MHRNSLRYPSTRRNQRENKKKTFIVQHFHTNNMLSMHCNSISILCACSIRVICFWHLMSHCIRSDATLQFRPSKRARVCLWAQPYERRQRQEPTLELLRTTTRIGKKRIETNKMKQMSIKRHIVLTVLFHIVMFACATKTVFISSRISESIFWPEFHIGSVVR